MTAVKQRTRPQRPPRETGVPVMKLAIADPPYLGRAALWTPCRGRWQT